MYRYNVYGDYFEYDELLNVERKHFDFEIKAPDSTTAMQIALDRIMLDTINTKNAVRLEEIYL